MKKSKLLPMLAVKGVTQNGNIYYPYIVSGIFSVFTYFVFSSILYNDLIRILPHSTYAWIMLLIGRELLKIILLLFLFYANSFLIKRRKKEMGVYSILGLEKKHIGMMLFLEILILYGVSICGGILIGTVLAKLMFLLLLRLSSLPVDVEFVLTWRAVKETLTFFAVIFMINLFYNLFELKKAQPVELLSGGKKGEKEPKFLILWSILGVLTLFFGYACAVRAKLDSMIFNNFFLAVFLVIVGTYLLFTSGSVAALKLVKRNRIIYYQPSNFITISGMYYRMKKNAASLSNICIFSTMLMITLTCTVTLYAGLERITHFDYPYDLQTYYDEEGITEHEMEEKVKEVADHYGLGIQRLDSYDYISLPCGKDQDRFIQEYPEKLSIDNYRVYLMTLEDYNHLNNEDTKLEEQEVLIYGTGLDYEYDTVEFMGINAKVKQEIQELFPIPKAGTYSFGAIYLIVVKDQEVLEKYVHAWADMVSDKNFEEILGTSYRRTGVLLDGNKEAKAAFVKDFTNWCDQQTGFFMNYTDGLEGRDALYSMNGGLLFIGIVFGLIFFMCLLLIMYYKQISEGYEDQNSFCIMQKVGMSDEEIKSTVKRQILTVFALPLIGSIAHTIVGMFMVEKLMSVLRMFNTGLLIRCMIGVSVLYILIYGVCYLTTSRTYYQIVKG